MDKIKNSFDEKEIFELLNDVNIDEKQYDDVDIKVSEIQKYNLKSSLKKQIKSKGKSKKLKYAVSAAAVILTCVIGGGFIDPTFAQNIPVLSSVIEKINGNSGFKGEYSKYSQTVEKGVTDKDLTLTIKEVVCDDNTLIIGYSIKSDKKIKDLLPDKNMAVPHLMFPEFKVNGTKLNVGSGGRGEYVDDYTYIGTEELDIAAKSIPKNFNFDIQVNNIGGINGNWSFKFSVSKEQISKKTTTFNPNTKVEFKDCSINIKKVSLSPIDMAIVFDGRYKKDRNKNISGIIEYNDWFVLDDKGVELAPKGASGGSTFHIFNDFKYQMHFEALKETPKYLTVIPYMPKWHSNKSGKYKIKESEKPLEGSYPIELPQGKMGKIIIKDIKVLPEKTIVYYTAEGLAPFSQAESLYIRDESDNIVEPKENLDIRKDLSNPNEYVKEFEALDKGKKYKLSARNFEDYDVREDLKFKIPLQ